MVGIKGKKLPCGALDSRLRGNDEVFLWWELRERNYPAGHFIPACAGMTVCVCVCVCPCGALDSRLRGYDGVRESQGMKRV